MSSYFNLDVYLSQGISISNYFYPTSPTFLKIKHRIKSKWGLSMLFTNSHFNLDVISSEFKCKEAQMSTGHQRKQAKIGRLKEKLFLFLKVNRGCFLFFKFGMFSKKPCFSAISCKCPIFQFGKVNSQYHYIYFIQRHSYFYSFLTILHEKGINKQACE